ncbi:hypothetical protein [Burkholderia ubonensis]|nr:hypothetical protein [Burkholderia ubonensis]
MKTHVMRYVPWAGLVFAVLAVSYCSCLVLEKLGPVALDATSSPASRPGLGGLMAAKNRMVSDNGVMAGRVDGRPLVMVFFDPERLSLPPDFSAKLGDLLDDVREHPDRTIGISGFRGNVNQAVSSDALVLARLRMLRSALMEAGVKEARIQLDPPGLTVIISSTKVHRQDIYIIQ